MTIAVNVLNNGNGNGDRQWKLTKEKILLFFGMAIITAEWIATVVFGRPFEAYWLLLGAGLCGVAIAQWGDKSGKS